MLERKRDLEPYRGSASASRKDIGTWCAFDAPEPSPPAARPGPGSGAGPRPLPQSARVVLADDHFLILDMLRNLIEPEFKVVGAVSGGQWLIDAVDRL